MIETARSFVTIEQTFPESSSSVTWLFPIMNSMFCGPSSSVFLFDIIATQLSSDEL